MAACDNCGQPAPFRHEFSRTANGRTIVKTIHFDDLECFQALQKKWMTHDRDYSDYLLNNWGTLPHGEEIQR